MTAYREMLHTASIGNEFITALSGVLRLLFFRRMFWVQFVPVTAGLVWCLWFFFRRASTWNCRHDGPALLVVSVLTTALCVAGRREGPLAGDLQAAVFAYQARGKMKIRNKVALMIFALLNVLLLLTLRSKVPFCHGDLLREQSGLVFLVLPRLQVTLATIDTENDPERGLMRPPSRLTTA